MYSKLPNLVLGFHGCDKSVHDDVINYHGKLKKSKNNYDWLGHGIYFWENNPKRAYEWALELKKRNLVNEPAVIGAIIDLGYCLNLLESDSLLILKNGYEILRLSHQNANSPLPQNKNVGASTDLLLRELDCAVIQTIHAFNKVNDEKPYDSVRAVFVEGDELYPTSGFRQKNHIQICIINLNCIKGYFTPLEQNMKYANL